MIGGRWSEVLQDDWVSLLTQGGQVTDVQLQLAAVLIEIQERGESLGEERMHGEEWRGIQFKAQWKLDQIMSLLTSP